MGPTLCHGSELALQACNQKETLNPKLTDMKDITELVAKVEKKQEVKAETVNLDEQLEQLKKAVADIRDCTVRAETAGKGIGSLTLAFDAACKSMDNAVVGICNAITRAHQTPLKVEMTDETKHIMEEGRTEMLDREAGLFRNHEQAIGRSIQTLETKFREAVSGYKGVFIDRKTYNTYFWVFFGLVDITLCSVGLLVCYMVKYGFP